MNKLPLVTIAIPTRNRVVYLRQALASAQNQTYPNLEIVVSDNASTDGTAEFLASIQDSRVKVFRQENMLPMITNWNFCLENVRGEYFLLLSDDDLVLPNCIETLIQGFASQDPPAFSFGAVEIFGNKKSKYPKFMAYQNYNQMILKFFQNHYIPTYACCILYKKTEIRYNSNIKYMFDAYFWMENLLKFKKLPRWTSNLIAKYREHPNSETQLSKKQDWFKDGIEIINYLIQKNIFNSTEKIQLLAVKKDYDFLVNVYQNKRSLIGFFLLLILKKPSFRKFLGGIRIYLNFYKV